MFSSFSSQTSKLVKSVPDFNGKDTFSGKRSGIAADVVDNLDKTSPWDCCNSFIVDVISPRYLAILAETLKLVNFFIYSMCALSSIMFILLGASLTSREKVASIS